MAARSARAASTRPYEFSVAIRVRHPDIDPRVITRKLGLEPQHAWARGDARKSPSGVQGGTRRESYWSAALPKSSERLLELFAPTEEDMTPRLDNARLAAMIVHAFDVAAYLGLYLLQLKREREFVQRLAQEGEVTLVVTLAADAGAGVRLEPSLLRPLAELGIRLDFEFE